MTRLLLVGALMVGVAGCSGSDDEIVVELGPNVWTVSGGPVDAGTMCSGGRFHQTAYLDLDGSPLAPPDGWELKIEEIFAGVDAPATFSEVLEHVCADGSGWFTIVWTFGGDGSWEVTDGAGAYRDMEGVGTLVIEREPSSEPDTPPGGWPVRTVATGTVEL